MSYNVVAYDRGEAMRNKRKKEKRENSGFVTKLKHLVILVGLLIFFSLFGYGVILAGGKIIVDEGKLTLDAATIIETTDGKEITKIYHENRTPVALEEIPVHVQQAFLAIEDQRFYEHQGIDLKSIVRAMFRNIAMMSKVEGGSTITQQLAKNLFLTNEKTWTRKAKEAMAALYLEKILSKEKILELYLNEVYFGEGVYGIEAASNYFFSKSASDLTIAEGALLAGIVKGPNGYSPIRHPDKTLDRRNLVLNEMADAGFVDASIMETEKRKNLGLHLEEKKASPWVDSYIDLVTKEAAEKHQLTIDELKRGGYRIVVHLDEISQKIAYDHFQQDEYFPGNTEGVEGAFVMMEQETGAIISAIGGRNYQLGDLNRVTVKRQPGSIMKPIAVYAPALMLEEQYNPFSLLIDQQVDHDGYMVSNADDQYAGSVTMYEAIVHSKNVPAVWLLDQMGIDYAKSYLEKMNLYIEDEGLAIALGGLEKGLSPLEIVQSYRTFVGEGKLIEAHTIDQIVDREGQIVFKADPQEKEVFSAQTAWNMTEMLRKAVTSGTAAAGDYGKALAGKTGTTQHPTVEGEAKDTWFAGFTPEYVMSVWMGYDQTDGEHYLTGGSKYPTMLTKAILTEIDEENELSESFTKPDEVEDLPEPIELPEITNVEASYEWERFAVIRGKISWEASADDRIVYRIYREKDGIDELIGEVTGQTEFIIEQPFFKENRYYVTAYDPLSKLESKRSEIVEIAW